MIKKVLALCLCGALFSCQNAPTKAGNQSAPVVPNGVELQEFQNFLKKKPVVLDARSPLNFSVSHTPGAISVSWTDFDQQEEFSRGLLLEDHEALARRLSLWGIDPETPVVVVGEGPAGGGEEGRIGWMLKYLGVTDVRIAHWRMIQSTIPRPEASPENKTPWKPILQKNYSADFEEFKTKALIGPPPPSSARLRALHMGRAGPAVGEEVVVLNVGEAPLDEGLMRMIRAPVKNLNWKKFIDDRDFPRTDLSESLSALQMTRNKTILVLSENALSSAAVTFVLRDLGYSAKNFTGGVIWLKRNLK